MARSKSSADSLDKARQVRISTLGRFKVEIDGQPLRFGTKAQRKPLELLKVVIALGGESVPVETLTESLWPDSEGDKAYNSFSTTLNRLRKMIGREALHLQDGRLALDPHLCWVDALETMGLISSAERATSAGDRDAAWDHLQAALSLYQGPFLDGEFDPPEILSARDKMHSHLMGRIEELGQFLDQNEQAEKAISLYQKGLAVDDLAESIYQRLLGIYLRKGRLAEGIAAYQRCRQILQAKLQVDPAPETEQAYQSILKAQEQHTSSSITPGESSPEPPSEQPPELTTTYSETPRSAGERRQATVLFSDLSGYTAMNEKLDPEEVQEIMSRIKSEAVKIVENHGGIVSQFVGDEVLALFGIPTAHEDDPRRAVTAALELHESARNLSGEVESKIGRSLRMHTGIHSGLIVTSLRDDRDGRIGVTGDTVNVGAHLASKAKADEILLSAETYKLVAPYFNTEALKPFKMKGRSQALTPYRVTGKSQVETRLEASEKRGFTVFSGRERELEALCNFLEKASGGEGQFVTVAGEAGVGKSRLFYEFHHGLDRDRITVLEGRCQSYGGEIAYLPFVDILRQGLRLREEGSPSEMREKAISNIRSIDAALEGHIPYFLQLLSLPGKDHRLPLRPQGDEQRRAFEEALAAFITLNSQHMPVVVLLEDWHWADEASVSALHFLKSFVGSHPLLIMVSCRPEQALQWGSPVGFTAIALNPVQVGATENILKFIFQAVMLPERLGVLIHERTGGNPLFIEEIGHALIEEGSVRVINGQANLTKPLENLALPNTVQAVIRSRVDRLEQDEQEILGLASVVGREFSQGILENVLSDPSGLRASLEELTSQELIQRIRVVPEIEYMFKHVFTQEVVYETLLLQRRKQLHALVGASIEASYSDRLPEYYEALADHFDRGEVWDKAVEFRVKAGIKARNNHLIGPALNQLDRAKDILENRTPELHWKVRYDLYLERSEVLGETAQWPLAYRELEVAEEITRQEGDRLLQQKTMSRRANAAFWGYMFDEAVTILAELEQLVVGDSETMLGVKSLQAFVFFMVDKPTAALAKEKETLELLGRVPNSPHFARASVIMGYFNRFRGDHRKAMEYFERAQPIQKELEGFGANVTTMVHYCIALSEQGQFEKAIGLMREALKTALEADSLYALLRLNNTLGWALALIFQLDQAIEYNEAALADADNLLGSETRTLFEIDSFARLNLADIHMIQGDLDTAKGYLETVYQNAGKDVYFMAQTRWKPRCLITLGEIWLRLEKPKKTEAFLAELEAQGYTELFPFKKHQVRANRLRGALLLSQGQPEDAEAEVKLALERALQLENPTEIWKSQQALGDLYKERGKAKLAKTQYRNAVKVIEGIANGLTNPELREGFLQSKPIRELFAQSKGV